MLCCFGLQASEFFAGFAPTGAEILSSEYTRPLRSLARNRREEHDRQSKPESTHRACKALLQVGA